jgi:hypothetical protein
MIFTVFDQRRPQQAKWLYQGRAFASLNELIQAIKTGAAE